MRYDFSGYATKANLRCSDGRIIRRDAFRDCDGATVPLVYQHLRDDPKNIIGNARLEHRADGTYAYCSLNNTDTAETVRELIRHGDLKAMSIYANHLSQQGSSVTHGAIREVSVVIAGANPGALIDNICIQHDDGGEDYLDDEAVIYNGWNIEHADTGVDVPEHDELEEKVEHADNQNGGNKAATVKEVFDSLTDDQKTLFYAMVGQALAHGEEEEIDEEEAEHSDNPEGGNDMSYNVFEGKAGGPALSHDDLMTVFTEARKNAEDHHIKFSKALSEAALEHGITDIDSLFPDYKSLNNPPAWIGEPDPWVNTVWNGTSKTPFSRVKSQFADITKDEARARGYIKGKKKIEEQFSLLKRTTDPQTVYKLQSLDRDDIIDITDFDVVAWLKSEMRMKLQEELSRAILMGDGRLDSDESKIKETHIRSILNDADFYALKKVITPSTTDKTAAANTIIDGVVEALIDYKGSGTPTAFMSPQAIASLRVAKDTTGRRLYNSTAEIASAMGVGNIVDVPPMKDLKRTDSTGKVHDVYGIIVNLRDYGVGADRGGQTTMFDDFDIDYNKYKYLIETRCSGALTKPSSAIILEGADVTPPSGETESSDVG